MAHWRSPQRGMKHAEPATQNGRFPCRQRCKRLILRRFGDACFEGTDRAWRWWIDLQSTDLAAKTPAAAGWPDGRNAARARPLPLKTVDPLALAALGGADLEAHFLGQASANEASDGVGLPVHGVQDVLDRGAVRALQHIDDLGLLAALARGGRRVVRFGDSSRVDYLEPRWRLCGARNAFGALILLLRDVGRLWRWGGRQGLDGLPDPAHCGPAVGTVGSGRLWVLCAHIRNPLCAGCAHDDSSLRFAARATQFFNKDGPEETR